MAIITLNNNSLSSVTALPAAIPTASRVLLNTTTITSDTTNIDFNNTLITSTYNAYEIIIEHIASASGTVVDIDIKLSADNGSSFTSQIDQLSFRDRQGDTGTTNFNVNRTDQSEIQIMSGMRNGLPDIGGGIINLFGVSDSNMFTFVTHNTGNKVEDQTDNVRFHSGVAIDDVAQAINFIRIVASSGDIAKAKVKLYGVA